MKKYAEELDASDPLSRFRKKFFIDDPELIYLDGNSLGRLPLDSITSAKNLVEKEWGVDLIRGWGKGWLNSPEKISEKLAKVIGAQPEEVIIADSTSINLFKLVLSALKFQSSKREIITDDLNFPSDLYVLEAVVKVVEMDHEIKIINSEDGIMGPEKKIISNITDKTALVTLSHTTFKSGYTYDLIKITQAAHQKGALTIFDLSHSVGSMPIHLNKDNVDMAVGCTYKYLNGGPGAPAFIYIRKDLMEKLINHIYGWMGKKDMFDFSLEYDPDPTIRQFLTGTIPVLSTLLIENGVNLILEAGIDNLRQKSIKQTDYLINLWNDELKKIGFSMNSPIETSRRGSHISLGHEEGWRIDQALINDMKVIPDFRTPNLLRLGIAPLYTSYVDIYKAIQRIKEVVEQGIYKKYSKEKLKVT
ncbi:MAG: kynureninase [Chloroflexi bacterium]|jgi:kynureninase|nr:kynureninase [Chloroflexota bacterium]MBT4003373.1 kynureninase [Chloroflexota bacterium]MBT4305932.1 kynureninase [Chloroflexota bacterium]MBT4533757.1 kynureninase [Chloroflexota bacterium]MBT4681599.1 kynureninase [Chloroflexota bacterium]